MPPIIISDTNIWIALHRAAALEPVFRLPYRFITTDLAFEELKAPEGNHLIEMGLQVDVLSSEQVNQLFYLNDQWRKPSVSDISCYLYASQIEDCILLTGDAAIRQQAEQKQLRVHGLLWLLDEMLRHNVLDRDKAIEILEAMLATGTFLPKAECDRRIKQWKTKER